MLVLLFPSGAVGPDLARNLLEITLAGMPSAVCFATCEAVSDEAAERSAQGLRADGERGAEGLRSAPRACMERAPHAPCSLAECAPAKRIEVSAGGQIINMHLTPPQ